MTTISRVPKDFAAEARTAMRAGDLLGAYDLAERGLNQAPDNLELKYLSVLALARSGATEPAARRFARLGLAGAAVSAGPLAMDIPALAARLTKDRALRARGAERIQLLHLAADAYQALFEATADPYPGANGAALMLWAGDRKGAEAMAARALAAQAGSAEAHEKTYWSLVTEAELRLLVGDTAGAAKAIEGAARSLARTADWQAVASTRRQLRRTCEYLDINTAFLDPLAPPTVMVYSGHMIGTRFPATNEAAVAAAIADHLEHRSVGIGFGSLAGGADILFAEALLARGGELNVVLPFALKDFIVQSVAPSGPFWPARFERCIALARTVRYATRDSYLGDDAPYQFAIRLAMGRARLRARLMDSSCALFAVWDGDVGNIGQQIAGTAADLRLWQNRVGDPIYVISPDGRQAAPADFGPDPPAPRASGGRINGAILFADVQGYGCLRESDLPAYARCVLAPIAQLLEKHRSHILTRNSWGDALFAVFDDVAAAAACALALQPAITEADGVNAGLLAGLSIRVAAHYGPIRPIFDPIQARETYMGIQVAQAARIEPVTEPGMVYVSEAFAAALALTPNDDFACDYLGEVETAKNFGRLPLYALRASDAGG